MRGIKRKFVVLLTIMIIVVTCSGHVAYVQAKATGNSLEEAFALKSGQKKTDYLTKDSSTRWFKIKVKEQGNLTIKCSSASLKQNAMLFLYYGETEASQNQSVRFVYDEGKKGKSQSVVLKSESTVSAGTYWICFRTAADTLNKKAKYTINAVFKADHFDDVEPNTIEDSAQQLPVNDISKPEKKLKMRLSSYDIGTDMVDRFYFNLDAKKAFSVRVQSKGKGTVRVLVYAGEEVLNADESKQYLSPNGKTKELQFGTKTAMPKGRYSVVVVFTGDEKASIDYFISGSTYTPVKEITLQGDEIVRGKTKKLDVKLSPAKANEGLVYKSSNTKVVTVNKDGVVKGIKKGTATISVTSKYTKQKATCKVAVTEQLVTGITLSHSTQTLTEGNSFTLKANVAPENAVNKEVSFESSNSSVASVSSSGTVTAKRAGTAVVTVTAKDGSKEKAACKVTVIEKVIKPEEPQKPKPDTGNDAPAPTISGSNNVKVNSSIVLTASVSGGKWSASSDKVSLSANSNKCTVSGASEGIVTVTYTANGKSASISIYVKG